MQIVKPSVEILTPINRTQILQSIEAAGRTCYKSEDKITEDSASKFVKMLISRGHESVLEHQSLSVRLVNDRGVSHEEVRHRLCSFSQESTRYINYTKENKGGEISVIDIKNHLKNPGVSLDIWLNAMNAAEIAYKGMIDAGESAQIARSVLPNSLKTEIVITANLRQWREVFRQRCSKAAHPQIREVMIPLYESLCVSLPEVFEKLDSAV